MILIHAGQGGIADVQVANQVLYPVTQIGKKQQLNERVLIFFFF